VEGTLALTDFASRAVKNITFFDLCCVAHGSTISESGRKPVARPELKEADTYLGTTLMKKHFAQTPLWTWNQQQIHFLLTNERLTGLIWAILGYLSFSRRAFD
jgi:hypothetical protein